MNGIYQLSRVKAKSRTEAKLAVCLIKQHVLEMYERLDEQLHVLLTAVLGGGEWSASRRQLGKALLVPIG
jgi:hypothetical protein